MTGSSIPRWCTPSRRYTQAMRPSERNAYVAYPNSHCGTPNSASSGARFRCVPSASSRYTFHHPVRSETRWHPLGTPLRLEDRLGRPSATRRAFRRGRSRRRRPSARCRPRACGAGPTRARPAGRRRERTVATRRSRGPRRPHAARPSRRTRASPARSSAPRLPRGARGRTRRRARRATRAGRRTGGHPARAARGAIGRGATPDPVGRAAGPRSSRTRPFPRAARTVPRRTRGPCRERRSRAASRRRPSPGVGATQHRAPTLAGAQLEPGDDVALDPRLCQAHAGLGDACGGDRRGPGPVAQDARRGHGRRPTRTRVTLNPLSTVERTSAKPCSRSTLATERARSGLTSTRIHPPRFSHEPTRPRPFQRARARRRRDR